MQIAFDRLLSVFPLRRPLSDQEAEAVRQKATQFAIDLLAKYKDQLAQRTLHRVAER